MKVVILVILTCLVAASTAAAHVVELAPNDHTRLGCVPAGAPTDENFALRSGDPLPFVGRVDYQQQSQTWFERVGHVDDEDTVRPAEAYLAWNRLENSHYRVRNVGLRVVTYTWRCV